MSRRSPYTHSAYCRACDIVHGADTIIMECPYCGGDVENTAILLAMQRHEVDELRQQLFIAQAATENDGPSSRRIDTCGDQDIENIAITGDIGYVLVERLCDNAIWWCIGMKNGDEIQSTVWTKQARLFSRVEELPNET